MTGHLTKLNRFTGKLIWRKNYVTISRSRFVAKGSRNTPYVRDLIIVGSNMVGDRLCRSPRATPSALGCASEMAHRSRDHKRTGQSLETKADTILHRKSRIDPRA